MTWDESHWDHDLLSFYNKLIHVRRTQPVLRTGTRRTVHLDPRRKTYAFVRETAGSSEGLVAAFNLGDEDGAVDLGNHPIGDMEMLVSTNADTGDRVRRSSVRLRARSAAILKPLG